MAASPYDAVHNLLYLLLFLLLALILDLLCGLVTEWITLEDLDELAHRELFIAYFALAGAANQGVEQLDHLLLGDREPKTNEIVSQLVERNVAPAIRIPSCEKVLGEDQVLISLQLIDAAIRPRLVVGLEALQSQILLGGDTTNARHLLEGLLLQAVLKLLQQHFFNLLLELDLLLGLEDLMRILLDDDVVGHQLLDDLAAVVLCFGYLILLSVDLL